MTEKQTIMEDTSAARPGRRRCYIATAIVVLFVAISAMVGGVVGAKSLKGSSTAGTKDKVLPVATKDKEVPVPPAPDAPPTLNTIGDFLFKGYDLLKGNPIPLGSANDEGFQEPIFSATYGSRQVTGDNRFSIPDGISVLISDNCAMSFSSTTMTTLSEYSSKLSRNAKVSGKASNWGVTAKFSASVDYSETAESLSSSSTTMVHSQAECSVYESRINTFTPPPFSATFLEALGTLPEEYNEGAYSKFLRAFGTHYVMEATMGAIFGEQSFISATNLEILENQELDLKATASLSGAGAAVEASGGQSTANEKRTEFRKLTTDRRVFTRGSRPPIDGKTVTWTNSVFENPVPVAITLARIDTIHGLDQAVSSAAIFENIQMAIDNYCATSVSDGILETCNPLSPNQYSVFSLPTDRDGSVVTGDIADGNLLPPVICKEGEFVTSVDFLEQTNVGFIDVELTCSGGDTKQAANRTVHDGKAGASCTEGFDAFRPYGQIHCCGELMGVYNTVGMKTKCVNSFDRKFVGYNHGGQGSEAEVVCGQNEQIVGMQIALAPGSDRGMTRFRLVCREF